MGIMEELGESTDAFLVESGIEQDESLFGEADEW